MLRCFFMYNKLSLFLLRDNHTCRKRADERVDSGGEGCGGSESGFAEKPHIKFNAFKFLICIIVFTDFRSRIIQAHIVR